MLKKVLLNVCLTLLSFQSLTWAASPESQDLVPLNDLSGAILYFNMSAEPIPLRTMLLDSASDLDNEFQARRYLRDKLPVFEEYISGIEGKELFMFRVRGTVGNYDFTSERFPISGIHENSYFVLDNPGGAYGPEIAVEIVNANEFRAISMPDDSAETLAARLDQNRRVFVEFTLRPVMAVQKSFNANSPTTIHRALQMYAQSAKVLIRDTGEAIASLNAASDYLNYSPHSRPPTQNLEDMLGDPWAHPWGSKDHYLALSDRYNLDQWQAFHLVSLRDPCIREFGYTRCQSMISRRQQLVAQCPSVMGNVFPCDKIGGIPFTSFEAGL